MNESGTNQGSGYRTSLLFLIVLALASLPYFLWPVKIPPGREAAAVAAARERPDPANTPRGGAPEKMPPEEERALEVSPASDPVTDVLRSIRDYDFQGVETVMTGRYLKDYEEKREPAFLETTDLEGIRLVSRGDGWMFLEAPYTPEMELYVPWYPWEAPDVPAKSVRLRMVEQNGTWKLEHIKVLTRP